MTWMLFDWAGTLAFAVSGAMVGLSRRMDIFGVTVLALLTAVGGGMVASVGYAMVINMMATKETWPFFILGFVLAAIPQLTLIALGLIGISLALIYLGLKDMAKQGGGNGGGSGDPLGDILNDYE